MADERKVTLKPKWFEDVENDPNFELNKQEMAYITYAAAQYGFYQEKINIGEIFGKEFAQLNFIMPNIYGQIDNIKNYDPTNGGTIKYNADAIKECRLKGLTAKEICTELGYPIDKAGSLTSNKGWIEAGKILKEKSAQNSTENTESVQTEKNIIPIKNTESVQKCTDIEQTDNTDNTDSVQKSNSSYMDGFDF